MPQGQKRPADAIGHAAVVARIAAGAIEETGYEQAGKVRIGRTGR